MKRQNWNRILGLGTFLLAAFTACRQETPVFPDLKDSSRETLYIGSSDTTLVEWFNWASAKSQSYVGNDSDPVGPWYEAALPAREAFCMRDVSHQCIGEEINGHGKQNRNMMIRFVENISESKDYCSYWEINKNNLPAPVDYENDEDFWYNLNANFDVMNAAYRLFQWTGDKTYIQDPRFLNFFRLTSREYRQRWQLEADRIMEREAVMNVRPTSVKKRFKGVRGLPSYEESVPDLKVTGDLLATIYRGMKSYAAVLSLNGQADDASEISREADKYAALYDSVWWNEANRNYYSYVLTDQTFKEGGTNMFTVWFDFTQKPERINQVLDLMETKETNVESMSYYPAIFYKYGRNESAYRYLQALYENERRDYPEVSSGMLEGIVCGMLGIQVSAETNTVITCPRLTGHTDWVSVENIPALGGKLSVQHQSGRKTVLLNKTDKPFTWKAVFPGKVLRLKQQGQDVEVKSFQDVLGNTYSYAEVPCTPGVPVMVEAVN